MVKDVTDSFDTDLSHFLHVNNYGKLVFDKLYLFLGGASVTGNGNGNDVTGGVATKIGGNYLAFYTAGTFVPKSGSASLSDDGVSDGQKYEAGSSQWNKEL
ncbi:MAG: hypothetical protein LBG27_03325 [Spirochaetaceae bacterium]|nr:hypothetical protein [Spirochaetaceae bacterium]